MSRRCQSLFVVLHAVLGIVSVQAQQVCDATSQARSSPSTRFVGDRDEGVVTDQPTQLMWARCAIGQTWRGDACTGTPTRHAWSAAQALAQETNRAGNLFYNDWRLPTLRELATVAERHCAHPRINLVVFPDTPSATFWTSSASVRAGEDAYLLDFSSGGVAQDVKTAQHHVRLVRDAP